MRILISNDDGVYAPGLNSLAKSLSEIDETKVIAPDRNRSAVSSSLSVLNPLRINYLENDFIAVNGTPTDCVHLALSGLFKTKPFIVVSGINNGANLGDDVIYSGTVAAAIEGMLFGIPSIAVSLVNDKKHAKSVNHYDTAAHIVKQMVLNVFKNPLATDTLLNVNVPNLPLDEIKGIKTTRLGQRHKNINTEKTSDPRGREIFWIGPSGEGDDAGEGTDFDAVDDGYVSVTPLQIDLTRYDAIDSTKEWLKNVSKG